MAPQTISSIIRSHACEFLDDRLVGLGESQRRELGRGDPAIPAAVGRFRSGILGAAVEKEQLDFAVSVAIRRGPAQGPDYDAQADLLKTLARRGCRRVFPRLALAARKLPVARVDGPLRPPSDKEPVSPPDQRNANLFG